MSQHLQVIDLDSPLFTVTVAARLANMHPQTLRTYDRMGLVVPSRTAGRGRRYSRRDVQKLLIVQQLTQEEGINLSGVQRILELSDRIDQLQHQVAQLSMALTKAQTLLQNSTSFSNSRVFTAESSGTVHMGRHHSVPAPRSLPAGRS